MRSGATPHDQIYTHLYKILLTREDTTTLGGYAPLELEKLSNMSLRDEATSNPLF